MPNFIDTAAGVLTDILNEVVDATTSHPPSPSEIDEWTSNLVEAIIAGTTDVTNWIQKLEENCTHEQIGRLLLYKAVLAYPTNPMSISSCVDFIMEHRLLTNQGILETFGNVASVPSDWELVLAVLANRPRNLDNLLDAIEEIDKIDQLVPLLLHINNSELFRKRLLGYSSRLNRIFAAIVDGLHEPPHSVSPQEMILQLLRSAGTIRRRTLRRLLPHLHERGWLNQIEIAEYLDQHGRRLVKLFIKALKDAGLHLARKHTIDPIRCGAEWIGYWQDRLADPADSTAKFDFSLTRLIIDTIVATANPDPTNELQSKAANALADIPPENLDFVRQKAATVQALINDSGILPRVGSCQELADIGVSAGGPFSTLSQALLDTENDPWDEVRPLTIDSELRPYYGWNESCIMRYRNGELTGQGLQDMEEFYPEDELSTLKVLPPAWVEKICVYDRFLKKTVRRATTADKVMKVITLDPREGGEWNDDISIAMAVDLEADDCVVYKADPVDGRQILVVDVIPAGKDTSDQDVPVNTIRIIGTGFISPQARVVSKMWEWEDIHGDNRGRLVPGSTAYDSGLPSTVDVYDSPEFLNTDDPSDTRKKKEIVFNWPSTALKAGLYMVQLIFDNTTGYHTTMQPSQNPETCELGLTDEVKTQVLWFVVLPTANPRIIRPVANQVDCVNLTDPEFWMDDIGLMGTLRIDRFGLVWRNGGYELEFTPSVPETAWDAGNNQFVRNGQTWSIGRNMLSGTGYESRPLELDELVLSTLNIMEIDGEADRLQLSIILTVIWVILLVIWTIIVFIVAGLVIAAAVAAYILLGIFTDGATFVPTAPVLAAFLPAVVVAMAGILTGTWTVLFPIGEGLISLLASTIPLHKPEMIVEANPAFSGIQIAYLESPLRFHRRLLPIEPLWIPSKSPSLGPLIAETDFSPSGVKASYEQRNKEINGTYRVHITL